MYYSQLTILASLKAYSILSDLEKSFLAPAIQHISVSINLLIVVWIVIDLHIPVLAFELVFL